MGDIAPSMEGSNLRVFSLDEIRKATHDFKETWRLGEGRSANVYKGFVSAEDTLRNELGNEAKKSIGYNLMKKLRAIMWYRERDHTRHLVAVVVKRLRSTLNWDSFDEWQLAVLEGLSHPNLTKLLGYCWEGNERLLVYEHMRKGSLDDHLYKESSTASTLGWETRMSIALGVARGLAFLHALERPIIHRHFEASDVLLDERFNAKITATLGQSDQSPVNCHVEYLNFIAPEVVLTGCFSTKSAVYDVGVLLLELLTGMRAKHGCFDNPKPGSFVWAKPSLCGKKSLKCIIDSRLIKGGYPLNGMFEIAQLVLRCLNEAFCDRPTMAEVVESLEHVSLAHEQILKTVPSY